MGRPDLASGDIVRFLISLIALLSIASPAAFAQQGRWETAARLDTPRAGLAVTMHDGRLYAAGGAGLTVPRAEFESYDPELDRWFPETSLPRGLEQFGIASVSGRIYVAGGYAQDEQGFVAPSAGMWSWSMDGNIWQSEVAMPAAKAAMSLVAVGGRLYAIGGIRDDGEVFAFDPEAREWETLEAPDGITRRGAAVVAVDGRIHVIGGTGPAGASAQHDIFDPDAGVWTRATDLPAPATGLAAAVHDGRIHVFGGRAADGRTTLQTHLSWAPSDMEWRAEADLPAPRTGADAAVLADSIYLVGGGTGGGFFAPFTAMDTTDVFVDAAN